MCSVWTGWGRRKIALPSPLLDIYSQQIFFTIKTHGLFIFCVLFVEAAGKIAREEGKHDLGSTPEDSFPDSLNIPPTTAELVSNPHGSRSERSPHRNVALSCRLCLWCVMIWRQNVLNFWPRLDLHQDGLLMNVSFFYLTDQQVLVWVPWQSVKQVCSLWMKGKPTSSVLGCVHVIIQTHSVSVQSPQVLQQIALLWKGLKQSLQMGKSFKLQCQVHMHTVASSCPFLKDNNTVSRDGWLILSLDLVMHVVVTESVVTARTWLWIHQVAVCAELASSPCVCGFCSVYCCS